jgi:hypothetical protein
MELPGLRTWVVFYLISFVVLLWVSLFLVLIIIGVNFVTVLNQVKMHAARKEFQRNLTSGFERGTDTEAKDGEEKNH